MILWALLVVQYPLVMETRDSYSSISDGVGIGDGSLLIGDDVGTSDSLLCISDGSSDG